MHTKDTLIDDSADWESIEALAEVLPSLDIVPPLALIVKSVHSVNLLTLMISPKQENMVRILNLERKK